MTLFGHDVSSYNPNYQPVAGELVIVKASEGAHTHDSSWPVLSARVKAKGAFLLGYHFLHSDSSPQAQAANTASVPGVKGVPLMVDVEVEGLSRPTIGECAAYVDAARALGLDPRLVYLPRWYWQSIGSPSLQPLIDRGLHLVSSAYPQQGHYTGDSGSGWAPYGGMTPLIWQYSSVPLDGDAFRGTLPQLKAALGLAPTPKPVPPVPVLPVSRVKEHSMLMVTVDRTTVPKTTPPTGWPGDFVLTEGTLVHIASPADEAKLKASGVPGPITITWAEYQKLLAGK